MSGQEEQQQKKKKGGSRRKRAKDVILPKELKASLTKELRSESSGPEEFENASAPASPNRSPVSGSSSDVSVGSTSSSSSSSSTTAPPKEQSTRPAPSRPVSSAAASTSTSSSSSSSSSMTSSAPTAVRILPVNEIHQFQGDVLYTFTQSTGTLSYDSPKDDETTTLQSQSGESILEARQFFLPREKVHVPELKVLLDPMSNDRAVEVSDYTFNLKETAQERPFTDAERRRQAAHETGFLQLLTDDTYRIFESANRHDIEVKVSRGFDRGMPYLEVDVVPIHLPRA